MSNRAKGQRFELRVQAYLESVGFKVDRARAAVRFVGPGKAISSPCDFLGCADLIAVHPGKPYTLFVQATTGGLTERRRKLESVAWNFEAHRVHLWTPEADLKGGMRSLWLRPEAVWTEFLWRMKAGEEPAGGLL